VFTSTQLHTARVRENDSHAVPKEKKKETIAMPKALDTAAIC
jgi:hypothetical protein